MNLFTQNEDPQRKLDDIKFLIGDEWYDALDKNILYNVATTLDNIDRLRDSGEVIFPSKYLAFRAFREVPFSKVKVLIMAQCPYPDGNADGLAFSCADHVSPSLRQFYHGIVGDPELVTGMKKNFPYPMSLTHLSKQGVMLLNVRLMVKQGDAKSLMSVGWQQFTEHVLSVISRKRPEVIFCMWGDEAKAISPAVNPNVKFLLECSHPVSASHNNSLWHCDHFAVINNILDTPIDWTDTSSVSAKPSQGWGDMPDDYSE